MEKPGTILLGNPANLVVSKVTQIAVLEKRYKVIDWIDDMKSNQLGQLYAIWNVSKSLVINRRNMTISDTIVSDIISNIVPKAVDMHTRIVDEHSAYHEKANKLRNQIATLVNEIKVIADAASGIDYVVPNDVVGVKRDQTQINAMRSKLLKIVQDNADRIDVSNVVFDATSDDKLSVQFTVTLNKMDYNDIDQLANIDRTTDPKEEHMHIDNDDHDVKNTITMYKFNSEGNPIAVTSPVSTASSTAYTASSTMPPTYVRYVIIDNNSENRNEVDWNLKSNPTPTVDVYDPFTLIVEESDTSDFSSGAYKRRCDYYSPVSNENITIVNNESDELNVSWDGTIDSTQTITALYFDDQHYITVNIHNKDTNGNDGI